jgi:hypothetical protein
MASLIMTGLAMPSFSRRQRPGSVAARFITAASAEGSLGPTSRPFTPSFTISAMPPMAEAMTGRRCRNASWITSGAFSHHTDGITTQSAPAISEGSMPRA